MDHTRSTNINYFPSVFSCSNEYSTSSRKNGERLSSSNQIFFINSLLIIMQAPLTVLTSLINEDSLFIPIPGFRLADNV